MCSIPLSFFDLFLVIVMSSVCHCNPCILHEKSKEKEKRLVECNSPGCTKVFHAVCIGHGKISERELNKLFFVCQRCENFLSYGAEIARKSIATVLDNRIDDLKKVMLDTMDEKISSMRTSILEETKLMCDAITADFEVKLRDIKYHADISPAAVQDLHPQNDDKTDALRIEMNSLKQTFSKNINDLMSSCELVSKNMYHMQMDKRKEYFIVRNFPENKIVVNGAEISNCMEAVRSIAISLGLRDEIPNIQYAQRLGKTRTDGKPRLIKVKSTIKAVKLFLQKARNLKTMPSPLSKVFLQEDLPMEINRRLSEMRKRAYDHRSQNPGESAFVKGKKLFINGNVVDEVKMDF